MKVVYECEKCGQQFHKQINAEVCETKHRRVECAEAAWPPGGTYPREVRITFEDGHAEWFGAMGKC